ncbi:hypothetical protein IRJ41_006645 [Triplophysa rosa]|uniref:F-box domain-containing protein n=1 Tax=Triplophysa rosa TaxID=992332 RepID=A0A9W7X5D9_TRIRA|nr:hypothetical protein IRJ41_006645 [Triplophysa rosa]
MMYALYIVMEGHFDFDEMPPEILWCILLTVVTEDGDGAFLRLSLTCKIFRGIVTKPSFRKQAHFIWLDSVINWRAFSKGHKEQYRVPYTLTHCLHCGEVFKDNPPGYVGDGKRGVLQGFYCTKDFLGYCSMDCFLNDGGEFQNEEV